MRRFAALAYESLIVAALAIASGFALLPLSAAHGGGSFELTRLSPAGRAGSFACLFAVCGAYCLWSWTGGRTTLSMKAWRLALRIASGAVPGVQQALLRYLAWWIGPVCAIVAYAALSPTGHSRWALAALAVNYLWALVDPERQFLHDRLAGTRIVYNQSRAGSS
jgi:uncharacterized RDD family membrane protein YckC